jgi:hypothetical protein
MDTDYRAVKQHTTIYINVNSKVENGRKEKKDVFSFV